MRKTYVTKKKLNFAQKIKLDAKKNWQLYLLFLPVLIYFIIFCYFPMAGISLAFQNYELGNGFFEGNFTLEHFIKYFKDPYLLRTLRNTLLYSLWGILFTFPSSIVLALMLNAVRKKIFKRAIQTASYMPYFISLVVICGLISSFLDPYGFIGAIFQKFHWVEEDLSVLGDKRFFRAVIIISDIWQGIGFGSIIYVAALSSIDPTLYEAAKLDNANRFQTLFKITIPCIMPTIMLMLILKVGNMLNVGYDKIVLLYSGETWEVAETISSYVYRLGFASDLPQYSYTTAIGLVNSVLTLILLFVSNFLSKKFTSHGLV